MKVDEVYITPVETHNPMEMHATVAVWDGRRAKIDLGNATIRLAFALDSDRTLLHEAAPGLFWAAVLLAVLLAVGRSFALEEANRARDGLRLSGLDGGSIFLGKAAAVAVELFLLEIVVEPQ